MLTEKQNKFFKYLKETYQNEPLPSYEIIAKEYGFKHKNSVFQYFNKLKEEELIIEKYNKFFISPELFGAVKFTSSVKAGFASVADDNIDDRISLDRTFNINNPSTFIFTVSGDSMIDLGIFEGDSVIVKKTDTANNGDIVVAYVDDGYTLKTYRNKNGEVYLEPANSNYPVIKPKEKLTIFGIAQGLVRNL